jgi:hypothetical protein
LKIALKREGSFLYPATKEAREKLAKLKTDVIYIAELNDERKRTNQQNGAIHLYCDWVAFELNNAGLVTKRSIPNLGMVEIHWTKDSVKEGIWKPIQKALLNKESTTDLNTEEVSKVYEHMNLYLGQKGISVPFPQGEEK